MPQVIGKRGQLVKISLERNNKANCSYNCKGLYRIGGEPFCGIIEDHMPQERPLECIKAEIIKSVKIKGFDRCSDAFLNCHPHVLNGLPICFKHRTNKKTTLIAKCILLED